LFQCNDILSQDSGLVLGNQKRPSSLLCKGQYYMLGGKELYMENSSATKWLFISFCSLVGWFQL